MTSASTSCRITGFKESDVTRSTWLPSCLERKFSNRMKVTNPTGFENSTSRSISLLPVCSFRATEPNTPIVLTEYSLAASPVSFFKEGEDILPGGSHGSTYVRGGDELLIKILMPGLSSGWIVPFFC